MNRGSTLRRQSSNPSRRTYKLTQFFANDMLSLFRLVGLVVSKPKSNRLKFFLNWETKLQAVRSRITRTAPAVHKRAAIANAKVVCITKWQS